MNSHQCTLIIQAQNGIHTRPGALFVKKAKSFDADIQLKCDGKVANAKSLFRLLTLPLSKGTQITITASGSDSKQAIESLSKYLNELS